MYPCEDVYTLQGEWEDWGRRQKPWPPKSPGAAFVNFCKQRGHASD